MSSHLDSEGIDSIQPNILPNYWLNVYQKMYLCRQFEKLVIDFVKNGKIKSPVYLSIGQEFIPANLSELPLITKLNYKPAIFAQHRAHSWFLCFGGNPAHLLEQIMGAQGSASISCKDINMFGHSGLLGDQVPIAVGYAKATDKVTICVMGDAAAEEDYVLGAMGFAATHNVPIIFIEEDNDLSILTKKKERRSWSTKDVSRAFGIKSGSFTELFKDTSIYNYKPSFTSIETVRHMWHCGVQSDNIIEPENDPLFLIYAKLIELGYKEQVTLIESKVMEQINEIT